MTVTSASAALDKNRKTDADRAKTVYEWLRAPDWSGDEFCILRWVNSRPCNDARVLADNLARPVINIDPAPVAPATTDAGGNPVRDLVALVIEECGLDDSDPDGSVWTGKDPDGTRTDSKITFGLLRRAHDALAAHPVAEASAAPGDAGESDDLTWFWEIVDAAGLADVPSDERAALRILVRRATQAAPQPAHSEPVAWQWNAGPMHPEIAGSGCACAKGKEKAEELAGRYGGEFRPLYAHPPQSATKDAPLTADFVNKLPGGVADNCSYSDVEDALDRAESPITDKGRYPTLSERIAAFRQAVFDHPPRSADARVAELEAALTALADATEAEVNEKGGGGYVLARLADARDTLAKEPRS